MTGHDSAPQSHNNEPVPQHVLEELVADAGNTFDATYIRESEQRDVHFLTYGLTKAQLEGTSLEGHVTGVYVDYFYHGLDEAYPTPSMNVSTTRTLLNGNVQNKIVQVCEELPTLESDGGVVAKVDSLEGPQPSVIPPTLEERLAEPLVDIGSLTMREVFIAGIADQAKQWAQLVSADAPKLRESNFPDATETDVLEIHAVLEVLRDTYPELRMPHKGDEF